MCLTKYRCLRHFISSCFVTGDLLCGTEPESTARDVAIPSALLPLQFNAGGTRTN